jgi:hypothetical protein
VRIDAPIRSTLAMRRFCSRSEKREREAIMSSEILSAERRILAVGFVSRTVFCGVGIVAQPKLATPRPQRLGADFPGVAGAEELAQVAFAALGLDFFDLVVDQIFVARGAFDAAQDADGSGETFERVHTGKREGV